MISLLFGPSGSGKTHTILNEMKRDAENGIRSFLIVPEQETVSAERRAVSALPPSAQLTTEVLNFSRLANRVFREYGGLSYHYIDKGSKIFLMHKIIRELSPFFRSFDSTAGADASLAEFLLAAVSEMKASVVSPRDLERAAEALPEDDPLRLKLCDIALIAETYQNRVATSFSDNLDDLTKLDSLLHEHDFFRGAHVYIDSFTSYTQQELNVIGSIARQADALTVTFSAPAPHANDLHLGSVIDTVRQIRDTLSGLEVTEHVLTGNHRAASPALALLAEQIWHLELTEETRPAFPADVRDRIKLCSEPSIYEEAEAVALRVLSLVRSGYRYRDIVVVCRDVSSVSGILDFVFDRYGIPYFLSEKTDLISLPPMKLLLSALRILALDFPLADVIAYLKTGLCGVSPADIDLFEEYATTWELSGKDFLSDTPFDRNPDGYTGDRSLRGDAIRDAANRVKQTVFPPLVRVSEALRNAETVSEQCDALAAFLSELHLDDALLCLSQRERHADRKQYADIYARLYPLILTLFDKIKSLSPEGYDEPLSPDEFESALRILLRAEEIGTIPTAVDEVTIGAANMLRASDVRCAILFGLCEGEFPAAIDDSGIFSSAERTRLKELRVELARSYDFRSSDELLYVSRAMALPSELLILSTHQTAANGNTTRPSMPFLRARFLLNYEKEDIESIAKSAMTDRILSPQLSLTYYAALKDTAAGEALRRLYREMGVYEGITDAAEIPVSDTQAEVSPSCAKEIFREDMRLSQSRLEKYVKCRFGYYCTYVLALREQKTSEFAAVDSGNFIHRILECFFRSAVDDSGTLASFSREEIERIADEVIAEYKQSILPPSLSMEESGRLPHLYRRLRELSIMMIENILDEFSASEFTPRFFELPINKDADLKPLEFRLKDGSTLTLPGVIDRVDLCRKDGKLYVRVVDYKTGTKEFTLSDLESGLNTQMLIYLYTLCHASAFFSSMGDASEIVPTGALYHSSALSEITLDTYPDESTDVRALAEKGFHRTGVLLKDDAILRAMNANLDPTYLPGVKRKSEKGSASGAAYVDAERLAAIEGEIREVICTVAEAMRSGSATAEPNVKTGPKSPCTYCKMRPICRRSASVQDEDGFGYGEDTQRNE